MPATKRTLGEYENMIELSRVSQHLKFVESRLEFVQQRAEEEKTRLTQENERLMSALAVAKRRCASESRLATHWMNEALSVTGRRVIYDEE